MPLFLAASIFYYMKSKRLLLLLIGIMGLLPLTAVNASTVSPIKETTPILVNATITNQFKNNLQEFVELTPRKYTELTGKKLTVKEIIQLKSAQKLVKKQLANAPGDDIPKVLYIVLAIFGLAWIVMGIKDDFTGTNWWVNLLLSLLCIIPGLIHALIKMDEYY